MNKLIFLISLLFLFSISINLAQAYTAFNPNPYFTSDINSTIFYQSGENTYSYNATCSGMTGCLFIENGGVASGIYVYPSATPITSYNQTWYDLAALYNYTAGSGPTDLILPANQEGIFILQYRQNASLTTPSPSLDISDLSAGTIYSYALNNTVNVWQNLTYIVSPATTNRNLRIKVRFATDNVPTRITFNTLKFYTYDIDESRVFWDSNLTIERLRYCGPLSSDLDLDQQNNDVTNDKIVLSSNNGWIFANGEDNYFCDVFKLGDHTIARRPTNQTGQFTMQTVHDYGTCALGNLAVAIPLYALYEFRDFNALVSIKNEAGTAHDTSISQVSLISRISLVSSSFQNLNNSGINTYAYAYTSSTPSTKYDLLNNSQTGAFNLNTTAYSTVNLVAYANTTSPSGSYIQFQNVYNSCNYPTGCGYLTVCVVQTITTPFKNFWSKSPSGCAAASVCDPNTNNQSFRNNDCSLTNQVYCGGCGCNVNLTACAFPTQIGSVCDFSDPNLLGVKTYYSDCSATTYSLCPTGTACTSYTSRNPPANQTGVAHLIQYGPFETIACLNLTTSTQDICINETGTLTNCSAIVDPTHIQYCQGKSGAVVLCSSFNLIEQAALFIGGLFVPTFAFNLDISESITALLISLIFAFICLIITAFKTDSDEILAVFGIAFIGALGLFTLATWFSLWLWVLLLVFDGLIVAGLVQKASGGK